MKITNFSKKKTYHFIKNIISSQDKGLIRKSSAIIPNAISNVIRHSILALGILVRVTTAREGLSRIGWVCRQGDLSRVGLSVCAKTHYVQTKCMDTK